MWAGEPGSEPEAGHWRGGGRGQTPCVAGAGRFAGPTHSGIIPTSGSKDPARGVKGRAVTLRPRAGGLALVQVGLAFAGGSPGILGLFWKRPQEGDAGLRTSEFMRAHERLVK